MIYVVTGTQRSGTSMIMQCLAAGGMRLYYDEAREQELRSKHPETNQGGYFELHPDQMKDIDFPSQAEGMAIKFHAPWIHIGTMAPGDYRIIIMIRDPREIVLSLAKFHGGIMSSGDFAIFERYEHYMGKANYLAKNRKDVRSVTAVSYQSVVCDPVGSFQRIADFGWPIDPEKAAEKVDPSLRKVNRFVPPPSGNLAKDLGIGHPISLNQAVIDGKINAPKEYVEAAKKGAVLGLKAT